MSLPENQMDPATEESTIDSPSRSDKRKRQRGISPVSRLQRPRIELEAGLDALHALPQEKQKMVEDSARTGILGTKVIHRYMQIY